MYEIKNNIDKEIVKHANYVFVRLMRIFEVRRKHIPSDEELVHIEGMKPIMFPIYFFSNTHTLIPTESYTTIKELKQAIMNKLELLVSKVPYYSLYEVCNKEKVIEERFLEDIDRVVDIIAVWEREQEDHTKIKMKIEFRIYVKIFIYYDYSDDDPDTVTLLYVQSNYDAIVGKLDLSIDESVDLASYQLYVNYLTDSEMAYKFLDRNLQEYIPKNIYAKIEPNEWIKRIYDKYNNHIERNIHKHNAKVEYLNILKEKPLFMAHQFNATVSLIIIC